MKWDMFFQGATFNVFPNIPGATFIQGATLIPESRVLPDKHQKRQCKFLVDYPKNIQTFGNGLHIFLMRENEKYERN